MQSPWILNFLSVTLKRSINQISRQSSDKVSQNNRQKSSEISNFGQFWTRKWPFLGPQIPKNWPNISFESIQGPGDSPVWGYVQVVTFFHSNLTDCGVGTVSDHSHSLLPIKFVVSYSLLKVEYRLFQSLIGLREPKTGGKRSGGEPNWRQLMWMASIGFQITCLFFILICHLYATITARYASWVRNLPHRIVGNHDLIYSTENDEYNEEIYSVFTFSYIGGNPKLSNL